MMIGDSLGTIRGQMILDVKQALAAYTQARQAHVSTVTALQTGAGALTAAGASIAGIGAVMAAGLLQAVSAAATFEKKLDFFQAITGATKKQYDQLSAAALKYSQTTIYSANTIADTFIELGKAGVPAQDIINGVAQAVINLGQAADLPLDVAANIITAATATFNLSAKNAVQISDLLAGAANASIIDVTDLGTSLKYAGGTAAALGIPLKDVITDLALLGQNGIKGSTAGTSLRTILLGLSGSTKKATEELKQLNIILPDGTNKFFDANGKAKSLAEIFQILKDATSGLNNEQRVSALRTIFQNRALASSIALTKNGADGFNKMAAAIDKTSAADVASKRLNNLSGDILKLQAAIQAAFIKGGTPFQDFARQVVQGVSTIIKAFSNLPSGIQTGILATTGIIGVILIAIGTFGIFAGSVLNIIALVLRLKDAYILLKGALVAMKAAQEAATAAQVASDAAFFANPPGLIVLAILAVIAAIVALALNWKQVTKFFEDNQWLKIIVSAIVPIFGLALQITDVIKNLGKYQKQIGEIGDALGTALNAAVKFIQQAVANVQSFVQTNLVQPFIDAYNFLQATFNSIVTAVQTGIANVIAFVQGLPAQIAAFFEALPGRIGFAIGFILGSIVRVFISIGTWVVTNVPIIINNIVNFFAALPGQIVAFFVTLYNNIVGAIVGLFNYLVIAIPQGINAAIAFFAALPGQVIGFFVGLYNGAVAFTAQLGIWLLTNIPIIVNNVIAFFAALPGNIISFFIGVVNNIRSFIGTAAKAAADFAIGIVNGIVGFIGGLPKIMGDILNNVINAIKGAIGGAIKAVTQFAAGLWNGFKAGLGIHSPSYIEKAMWQITGVIADETENMRKQVKVIQGLGNGITEVGNNIGNGFGSNLSTNIASLYDQMTAAKDIQSKVAFTAAGSIGVDSTQTQQLASIDETLKTLSLGTHIDKVEINNPEPEPASTSLPSTIRSLAYATT